MNRFLKKLIFLQSANMPRAEIELDGNIQLLGGNSTGKSTIQKAILFFYNASPTKLGLERGQKSFINFYYPYANSMIIYELMGESPFCVVTRVNGPKVVFYFVDSAYKQDWFINVKEGIPYSSWSVIKRNILEDDPNIFVSAEIDTYKKFRDIISGSKEVEREYRRFYLFKSKKYDSIANVIQNVYLCKDLDLNIIKDIIIDSAFSQQEETEDKENLMRYRSNLQNFEKDYNDLVVWKRNKKLLKEIIGLYNQNEQSRMIMIEKIKQWNFSYKNAISQLKELDDVNVTLKKEIELLEEKRKTQETAFYDKSRRQEKEMNQIARNIEIAINYKKGAEKDNIEQKILAWQGLEGKISERKTKQQELSVLEKEYKDEMLRFNDLKSLIINSAQEKINSCDTQINKAEKNLLEEKTTKHIQQESIMKEAKKKHEKVIAEIDVEIQKIKIEISNIELELQNVNNVNPYKDRFAEFDNNTSICNDNRIKFLLDEKDQNNLISKLRAKGQRQIADVENEKNQIQNNYINEEKVLLQKIQKVQDILDNLKGSFMEWLDNNVEGWEDNIGKIVDEESIIYNNELCPVLSDAQSDNLYGVKINTTGLKRKFRTPKELQKDKDSLIKQLDSLKSDYEKNLQDKEQQKNKLQEKVNSKIENANKTLNEIKANILSNDAKIASIKIQRRKLDNELISFHAKMKHELSIKKEMRSSILEEIQMKRKDKEIGFIQNLKKIESEYAQEISTLEEKTKRQIANLNQQKSTIKKTADDELKKLADSVDKEINDKGVDIIKIEGCKDAIKKLENEIDTLNKYHEEIVIYNSHKKEYIDNINLWKSNMDSLSQEIDGEKQSFAKTMNEINDSIKFKTNKIENNNKTFKSINGEVKTCQGILTATNVQGLLNKYLDFTETETACDKLLKDICGHTDDISARKNTIMCSINDFMKQFKDQDNLFGLKNIIIGDESVDSQMSNFVTKVSELIENNTEVSYEQSLFRDFSDIPQELSRYVGEIYKKRAEIDKILNILNKDFANSNFANQIRELRFIMTDSNDPLILHLKEMQHFWNEHQDQIGGMGLFAQQADDYIIKETMRQLNDIKDLLDKNPDKKDIYLKDTFGLRIAITENDNKNMFSENVAHVGSTGINVTARAIIFVLLINAFKKKTAVDDNFFIHCLYDEILNIDDNNIEGILNFANDRNIRIVTCGPSAKLSTKYRRSYILHKDNNFQTEVKIYHRSNN